MRERRFVRLAFDLDLIDLLDAVARVRQSMRQWAVVRQQEHTGRVDVETTYGDDTFRKIDELDNGRSCLWVARGRHRAGRLVQEHVREPLRRHLLAVHLDTVTTRDERVQLSRLAVHTHATGLDQLVGGPAGRNSGASEIGVQT